jgi:hypothetical protein
MCGPSRQESRSECTGVAATRNCQQICRWQGIGRLASPGESLALALVIQKHGLDERSEVAV